MHAYVPSFTAMPISKAVRIYDLMPNYTNSFRIIRIVSYIYDIYAHVHITDHPRVKISLLCYQLKAQAASSCGLVPCSLPVAVMWNSGPA